MIPTREAVGDVCEESRADSQIVKHLVMFLDVAYRKHNKAMTGVYRELFFKLVTQAARSENILAIELQQRAAGL